MLLSSCEVQKTQKLKVMFLWTILSSVTVYAVTSQVLDKHDCGNSSSCFSKSERCTSADDCEYLLKYSVSGEDVVFELSSNKYQWISVGFNSKPQMSGGKSLVCEIHENKVILNHYDMPDYLPPRQSDDAKAVLLNSSLEGNILYCNENIIAQILEDGGSFPLYSPLVPTP